MDVSVDLALEDFHNAMLVLPGQRSINVVAA
jgi:hypothetical protein